MLGTGAGPGSGIVPGSGMGSGSLGEIQNYRVLQP